MRKKNYMKTKNIMLKTNKSMMKSKRKFKTL